MGRYSEHFLAINNNNHSFFPIPLVVFVEFYLPAQFHLRTRVAEVSFSNPEGLIDNIGQKNPNTFRGVSISLNVRFENSRSCCHNTM